MQQKNNTASGRTWIQLILLALLISRELRKWVRELRQWARELRCWLTSTPFTWLLPLAFLPMHPTLPDASPNIQYVVTTEAKEVNQG